MTEKNERDERLAIQLRENLKKRKARARGLVEDAVPAPGSAGPAPADQRR